GDVAAEGVAMPVGQEAVRWERLASVDPRTLAREVFATGTRYLAASVDLGGCTDGFWATLSSPTEVRFRPSRPAPDAMPAPVLAPLPRLPSYAQRQAAYERFKKATSATRTLPAQWVELHTSIQLWRVTSPDWGDLLVSYVAGGSDADGFLATLLSVWSVA